MTGILNSGKIVKGHRMEEKYETIMREKITSKITEYERQIKKFKEKEILEFHEEELLNELKIRLDVFKELDAIEEIQWL